MLTAISPIDGRYEPDTAALSPYFSEMALFRYRVMVEMEYLIALAAEPGVKELKNFSKSERSKLRSLYKKFTLADAERIKKLHETTDHDVKAVEYFMKEKLSKTKLVNRIEWIHFALTSEDVNNLSYSLMWKNGVSKIYLPELKRVQKELQRLARAHRNDAMLSLTHGQPATPTTVGKEFAVFAQRLARQIRQLQNHELQGKLNGASGTWAAHDVAYPNVDWLGFTKKFVTGFGLDPNLVTTQIENHDSLAESYHILMRINSILLDLTRDIWMYISRDIFSQKKKAGEVGSSTMPHKINPIKFENAEGNLGIANATLSHLAEKLTISRMQRDLSGSTVIRNQGVPLAHSFLACTYILRGLLRLKLNKPRLNRELNNHWELLAEPIQTILRKIGHDKPYEELKKLTRGQTITQSSLKKLIKNLDLPAEEKQKLLKLTPTTYLGLAKKLPLFYVRNSRNFLS